MLKWLKWILRLVILGLLLMGGAYAYLTISASSGCRVPEGITESKDAPSIEAAPFIIQTPSRLYYAESAEETPKIVVLHNYFEMVGKKWVLRHGDLVMNRNAYGKITVKRR